MLKSVTVINDRGEELYMPLGNFEESGFLITNIEGIGAGNANINTTNLATVDGSVYNSARRQERNIVLTLRFFKPMIEDSRHDTYVYFRVKSKVTLQFVTDRRQVEIDGYIESNEPVIFSQEEYTQISVICPFPYFDQSGGAMETMFSGVEPMFEFPFENNSLTEKLLIMSELISLNERTIWYAGDAITGFTITIQFLEGHDSIGSYLQIYNLDSLDIMRLDYAKIEKIVGRQIAAGDELVITTEQGNKGIWFTHDGESYNVFNALDRNAGWFKMLPGYNSFGFVSDAVDFLSKLTFKMTTRVLYEGV